MAIGGRICPHCKRYTAKDEPRCIYCNQYLGPQWLAAITKLVSANGLLATNVIAGLCLLWFIAEVVLGTIYVKPTPTIDKYILFGVNSGVLIALGALSVAHHEAWRLLASCFLHMGAVHMLMNLWALYDFGRAIEPQLRWPRFFVSFVVTGVLGFVASEVWYASTDQAYITAGASGAVFGVQGLLLGDFLAKKDPRFQQFLWRTIVYSFIFYYAMRTNQAAHMGGLAVGIALGYFFGNEARPWYREKYFKAAAAVCLAAIIVTIGIVIHGIITLG
jgi:rhomboid protease GluP